MAKGYTYKEMSDFGFYDRIVIATSIATAEEAEWGCSFSDDCPCCTCGADVALVVTYAGVRWSRSAGRMVEETHVEYLCSAHLPE